MVNVDVNGGRCSGVNDHEGRRSDNEQLPVFVTAVPVVNHNPSPQEAVDEHIECRHSHKWQRIPSVASEGDSRWFTFCCR